MTFEADRIRDAEFENFDNLRQSASAAQNAGPLAGFLDITIDRAQDIAATEQLFAD